LKLIARGVIPSDRAASAISPRIRLYPSRCAATSLRTISGLRVLNIYIFIFV
jgi:hypothetical protein